MKKLILSAVVVLSVSLTGCDKIKDLTRFDIPVTKTITIPAAPVIPVPVELSTDSIETGYAAKLNEYHVAENLVDKITLKSFIMTIDAPATADFTFLKSIKIYISAKGLDKKLVASKTDISDTTGNSLTLNVEAYDYKSYIFSGKIKLYVEIVTDKATLVDYTMTATPLFTVDANILGL